MSTAGSRTVNYETTKEWQPSSRSLTPKRPIDTIWSVKTSRGISAGEVNLPEARKFYAGLRQVTCSDDAQLALRAKRPLRAQTSSWHSSRRCYRDVLSIAVKRRGR
jgi:hypothetical protein